MSSRFYFHLRSVNLFRQLPLLNELPAPWSTSGKMTHAVDRGWCTPNIVAGEKPPCNIVHMNGQMDGQAISLLLGWKSDHNFILPGDCLENRGKGRSCKKDRSARMALRTISRGGGYRSEGGKSYFSTLPTKHKNSKMRDFHTLAIRSQIKNVSEFLQLRKPFFSTKKRKC